MRILLLDDDPVIRSALERILAAAGHEVLEAATASYAVRLLTSCRPDVVLLDVMLGEGELDGLDVARFMRDDPQSQKIPVIITSGLPPEEIRQRARTNALDGLRSLMMPKPIDADELLKTIEEMTQNQ